MAELAAECLDDPRVRLVQADVADVIGAARGLYDAILLDVANRPDGLVSQATDRLYSAQGIAAAISAPRPGGCFAHWCAARTPRIWDDRRVGEGCGGRCGTRGSQ